jgi:hypothetical protein
LRVAVVKPKLSAALNRAGKGPEDGGPATATLEWVLKEEIGEEKASVLNFDTTQSHFTQGIIESELHAPPTVLNPNGGCGDVT